MHIILVRKHARHQECNAKIMMRGGRILRGCPTPGPSYSWGVGASFIGRSPPTPPPPLCIWLAVCTHTHTHPCTRSGINETAIGMTFEEVASKFVFHSSPLRRTPQDAAFDLLDAITKQLGSTLG